LTSSTEDLILLFEAELKLVEKMRRISEKEEAEQYLKLIDYEVIYKQITDQL